MGLEDVAHAQFYTKEQVIYKRYKTRMTEYEYIGFELNTFNRFALT